MCVAPSEERTFGELNWNQRILIGIFIPPAPSHLLPLPPLAATPDSQEAATPSDRGLIVRSMSVSYKYIFDDSSVPHTNWCPAEEIVGI